MRSMPKGAFVPGGWYGYLVKLSRQPRQPFSSSTLFQNKFAHPGLVPHYVAVSPRICHLPCLLCLYTTFCVRAIVANGRAAVPTPGPIGGSGPEQYFGWRTGWRTFRTQRYSFFPAKGRVLSLCRARKVAQAGFRRGIALLRSRSHKRRAGPTRSSAQELSSTNSSYQHREERKEAGGKAGGGGESLIKDLKR
jgi:hypothetical protein